MKCRKSGDFHLYLLRIFFLLTACLSPAIVDLFVRLRLSHLLETPHFREVWLKRLERLLAGGLRDREGTPAVL